MLSRLPCRGDSQSEFRWVVRLVVVVVVVVVEVAVLVNLAQLLYMGTEEEEVVVVVAEVAGLVKVSNLFQVDV
jgi:hypothetical protein